MPKPTTTPTRSSTGTDKILGITRLEAQKKEAVDAEKYAEAEKIRLQIDRLKRNAAEIIDLEAAMNEASDAKEFIKAGELHERMNALKRAPTTHDKVLERVRRESQKLSMAMKNDLVAQFKRYLGSSYPKGDVDKVLDFIAKRANMHVNVKLNKMVPRLSDQKPITILESFCHVGRYLTMFDVGHSGVGTDADTRRGFERRFFFGAYEGHDKDRPRYGNLNLLAHLKGDKKSARYGQSYLVTISGACAH